MAESLRPADQRANDVWHWCLGCERVSATGSFPGFHWTCAYPDCPMHQLDDDRPFVVAASWAYLRQTFHPEYPEIPNYGERYAMPEYRLVLTKRDPSNPYLNRTRDE